VFVGVTNLIPLIPPNFKINKNIDSVRKTLVNYNIYKFKTFHYLMAMNITNSIKHNKKQNKTKSKKKLSINH